MKSGQVYKIVQAPLDARTSQTPGGKELQQIDRRLKSINKAIKSNQIKSEGNLSTASGLQYKQSGVLSDKSSLAYSQRFRQIMKEREKKVMREKRSLSKRNSLDNNVIIEES